MFPSVAGAAYTDDASSAGDRDYRWIWLISQPGFGIQIHRPAAGSTEPTVSFQNMKSKTWVDTFLYTDPDTKEKYYVVKPTNATGNV